MSLSRRAWLCVPPTAACWADVGMTLAGQGTQYWAGGYAHVREFNPVARALLQSHPLTFVAAAAASSVLVAALLLKWRSRLAMPLSFAVTFCHAVAAAAWLLRFGAFGLVAAGVVLFMAERLWTWCTLRPAACRVSPGPTRTAC